jgi:hypothetical protein
MSDHRHTVLYVYMIRVITLVHFVGTSVSQDKAAHSDSKKEHNEENIHVGVVITAREAIP